MRSSDTGTAWGDEALALAGRLRRRVEQADDQVDGRVDLARRRQQRDDVAVEIEQRPAKRAVRISRAQDAVGVVVGPVEEEHEAALARSRVVSELVEEFVDHAEAARQLREGFAELPGRGSDRVDDWEDLARERTDLVLDDRRRRFDGLFGGFLSGSERGCEWRERVQRGADDVARGAEL